MKRLSAFTLIELLMVIGIIAGLTVIGLITYPGAQRTARDTTRKSDIRQFQTSLEAFANRSNGFYPYYSSGTSMSTLCTTLGLTACPDDPQATNLYRYISNAGSGSAGSPTSSGFTIYALLERPVNNAVMYWVACSNGNVGRIAQSAWTPSSTCPNNLVQ